MPRSLQEIVAQADDLATHFEKHNPDLTNVKDARTLREVRGAFLATVEAQSALAGLITVARAEGHSWAAIGAMVGTSGEAARQRYGQAVHA